MSCSRNSTLEAQQRAALGACVNPSSREHRDPVRKEKKKKRANCITTSILEPCFKQGPRVSARCHRRIRSFHKSSTPSRMLLLDMELVRAVRRAVGRAPRAADYAEALAAFAEPLAAIPLPVQCDVDTAQAFRDASREEIMLNGVRFVGDHRTEAFVAAVKRIVSAHVGGDAHPERALLVADRVMRGCSRTLSGADSFFAVHELFAAPELLIKPRGSGSVPLDVTLGRDCQDQRFKCRIKSVNHFGLYANEDVELLLQSDRRELDAPLLAVDAIVVETMDLTADKSSRRLTIRSPDAGKTPTRLELEARELF